LTNISDDTALIIKGDSLNEVFQKIQKYIQNYTILVIGKQLFLNIDNIQTI